MAIYVGDKGIVLELEFRDYEEVDGDLVDIGPLDISAATEITFLCQKPDGTAAADKTKTGGQVAFTSDGTDGKARYATEDAFIDQAGTWKRQALVELSGNKHHSQVVMFKVNASL